ncbi:MAG: GNAT family N-acetyltransferase [Acidimicrobiales bacterium]
MSTALPELVPSPRLEIRTWCPDDAPALVAAVTANLEHLRPWMPWIAHEPATVDDRITLFSAWEEARQAGSDVVYGLFLDGEVVGGTGFHGRIGPGGLEIGYWVTAARTRQGIATEAARSLTEVALRRDGIDRVEIHHDQDNAASGGIPRVLGYEMVDRRAVEPTAPGESGVHWIWRLTRSAGSVIPA